MSFKTYLWIMYRSFISGDSLISVGSGPGNNADWAKHVSCIVALLFYFQSVFTSLEVSRALRIVCKSIDSRMRNIAAFFTHAATVIKNNWDDGIRDAFFPDVHPPSSEIIERAGTDVHGTHPSNLWSMVRTFGTSLSRFKCFDKESHRVIARAFYATEAISHIARLTKEEAFAITDWKFDVNLEVNPTHLDLQGLWHPCLRPEEAVDNNVMMGRHLSTDPEKTTKNKAPNILLTGPNAGGKSMLIKASMIGVIMAQSLGIAPCKVRAHITPFDFLSSQINMPDVKGHRSLFEEEMHRAQFNLNFLRDNPRLRAFIVIDEIFSSTNPLEGIAGAYAVALNLAKRPQAACIVSTHYTYLSRLHKACDIVNMQMPVKRDDENNFVYPYKLTHGVCRQYIALELLQRNDFDSEVIDMALSTKRSITQ